MMDEAPSAESGVARYRAVLERLDAWFAEAVAAAPGVIPCKSGCTACCYGPFDISVADTELLLAGLAALSPADRRDATDRAAVLLARMRVLEPEWVAPYRVADLGDARFDELCDTLAAEPCPMLGETGACRIYADRPLVCRLIGLPLSTPDGRQIENACPIQAQFPAYAAMLPRTFDLEALEADEDDCLADAAARLFGNPGEATFETTIAAAIVHFGAAAAPVTSAPGAGGVV